MHAAELLNELGYQNSPNFLSRGDTVLETAQDFGHIFRRAELHLGLQGVYAIRPPVPESATIVPVIYVCRARSEAQADEIHRLAWNQNVVPYLIVYMPSGIKVYSGFRHSSSMGGNTDGVLQSVTDFNNAAAIIEDFHATSIDSGRLWHKRGKELAPERRVDWKLLGNLRTLDRWLCSRGLKETTSHALIGKYVYLHYLQDRGILSNKKLSRWSIDPTSIFGRTANLKGLRTVIARLDKWLNGCVFPIDFGGHNAPNEEHIRCVAGVFSGDDVSEIGDRQLSLDFGAYDFSYIPIETLSTVYEQFLHAPDELVNEPSRGRQIGAYYTPVPVVNLMIAEMEERRPLHGQMRVFDPSCGSGAFLVQCYRRLIEKVYPPGSNPKPGHLRDLLQRTIFGVDAEQDACNVTELSLVLTLLDYVNPPDLEGRGRSRFQLPVLRESNILCTNFFGDSAQLEELKGTFDWIVGNPPWKRLNPNDLGKHESLIWKWMKSNDKQWPVGGNQVARAFAWEVLKYLTPTGEVGLFLPAMTLFENPARRFRQTLFRKLKVNTVVNFSNLAEVLSAGRFRVPAASFFYELREEGSPVAEHEFVRTYSPLVANQEVTRPVKPRKRNESWSLVINASEVRDIPTTQVSDGSGLPWKLATWGSSLDLRLLDKLNRKFPSIRGLERDGKLVVSEGLQLRSSNKGEAVELVEGIADKNKLDVSPLKGLRDVFSFPRQAIVPVEKKFKYARKGRVELPLSVCRPPHIIVSAARTFAVYSEQFLVVPGRQIGIVSPSNNRELLKALSLYLSSDFAFYHQFLTSTQFGVQRGRATLNALRRLPIGIGDTPKELRPWLDLHNRLKKTTPRRMDETEVTGNQRMLPSEEFCDELVQMLAELNDLVSRSLSLDDGEQALVHDLIQVRLELNDGKVGKPATRIPKSSELRTYAERLKSELDDYLNDDGPKRHSVAVVYDGLSGMIQIDLSVKQGDSGKVTVVKADDVSARELEKTRKRLREERSQWIYFDRNLHVYEGTRTLLFKPMQRFHWTMSQAMIDARGVIAGRIERRGNGS